jgi:hypothetical protein
MDLLYSLADAILRFMDAAPPMPIDFVCIAVAAVPVTLLHELGHAVAARDRLGGDVQVSVGSTGKIAEMHLGKIAASINLLSNPARVAGSASFDATRASAHDVLWIALAGPLASLAAAVPTAVLYAAAPSSGFVHGFLWAALGGGVFGVLNLVPFEFQERRGGPRLRTDGRLALDALKVARALR